MSNLSFDRAGSVISLTLASGKLNPLTEALLSDLEAAVDEIDAACEECRVVVVRGRGGHLTAGGHMAMLQHLPPLVPGHVDPVHTLFRRFGTVFDRLSGLPQAVVTCVDGVAIGGGLGLLCASDVVLATTRSRFEQRKCVQYGIGIIFVGTHFHLHFVLILILSHLRLLVF